MINNLLEIHTALHEWNDYDESEYGELTNIIIDCYIDHDDFIDECNDGLTDLFSFIIVLMGESK